MDLGDLKRALSFHDRCKAEGYREDDKAALSLVIHSDKAPKAERLRTPFGLCTILNCKQKEDSVEIVFIVSRQQLIRAIKIIESYMEPTHDR